MTEWHNQRRVRADELFRGYIIRCSWDRKDLFFPAVQIQRKDILLMDLGSDDPGMILITLSAGKEESSVYYGENVPLFRRNGYRKSGTMILRVRSRDTALK